MIADYLAGYLDERRWVAWRYEERAGSLTKVPYQTATRRASSTDPSTWLTYAEAQQLEADGIGIMLTGDGLGGVDLDECRDPETGELADWAREIVDDFRSYAEVSPSGRGVKVLAAGAPRLLPGSKYTPEGVETSGERQPHADVFVDKRFFTLTGQIVDGVPDEVADAGELGGAWERMVARIGSYRDRIDRTDVELPSERVWSDDLRERMSHHPLTWHRWKDGTEGGADRSANDAALASAMAMDGFSSEEICAALENYDLGQIGSGKLEGYFAERQLSRLLGLAEQHRPKPVEPHPAEAAAFNAAAIAEGFIEAERRKAEAAARAEEERKHTPLLTWDQMRVGSLIHDVPPEREWIIPGILPLGIVGTVAAAGGTGKSMAMLQLALSVVCEVDFWGLGTPNGSGVMIVSAEDDRDEFHRRLHRVLDYYVSQHPELDVEAIDRRLAFLDRVGHINLLTAVQDRSVTRTELADRIVATAAQVPDCRLIIADPLSRFRGGGANGEEEATRFVEALEAVRKGTGASVISPAHTNKDSQRMRDGSQAAVRGSSALVDGMRWAATMMPMSEEEAKERGMSDNDARSWVKFAIPKNNYAPPFDPIWLHRIEGGVLVPDQPADVSALHKFIPKGEREYQRVIRIICEQVRKREKDGIPTSVTDVRQMGGVSGLLKIGVNQVAGILERGVEDGWLERQRDPENAKKLRIIVAKMPPKPREK